MAFKSQLIFAVLKNILVDKSQKLYAEHVNNEVEFKTVSAFVLLRYLSMHTNPVVRQIVLDNQLSFSHMDIKIIYKLLLKIVPKQRSSYIAYIK